MQLLLENGGARVGGRKVAWPFARLTVSPEELRLNVRLVGKFSFTPSDVEALEALINYPLLGRGIRIHHQNPDYPELLVFYTLHHPIPILTRIKTFGFICLPEV
ncbi:MAG: hypothetical protein HC821_01915 [Lewinella sp.]|nr:hypothetical protein [Lewinella sp.]